MTELANRAECQISTQDGGPPGTVVHAILNQNLSLHFLFQFILLIFHFYVYKFMKKESLDMQII